MKKKIIVVGGGAAGLMAAGRAAERGHEVHLYEKNNRIGKKILITGKGRCNVTNDSDVEGLLENIPGNPYFLYSAFYQLDSFGLQEFFNEQGLELKVERGKRVFPVSDRYLESPVEGILIADGRAEGIRLKNGKEERADGVIVCTGGLSYPGTGSTGDGYRFAKAAGHHVTKLYPSLVPLRTEEDWCHELMGLSLKNIEITIKNKKGKKVYSDFGEMLFTHFGVSGPLVLSASSYYSAQLAKWTKKNEKKKLSRPECRIELNLKPALTAEQLDKRLLREFDSQKNKNFGNAIDGLFPARLIPVMLELSGIEPEKKVHEITKQERQKFAALIRKLPMTVEKTGEFAEAIITRGGVYVKDVNPSTMESKRLPGLYFAGEVLDVDALTGGFNLQVAWSTGYLAGTSAAGSNKGE